MINKTKNNNVGNDNLDNVSNTAPDITEEDDLDEVDKTKDKLESILSALRLDPLRPPTGSLQSTRTYNSSEKFNTYNLTMLQSNFSSFTANKHS